MKKIAKVVNNKGYLLGVLDNQWIYLKKPSWDCGWYWGFGYLQYYTRNCRSGNCHTHFDSVFFDNSNCTPTEWKNKSSYDRFMSLGRSTLNENEMWKLLDYMRTFYTLQKAAEVFGRGGSNYTSKANLDIIKNDAVVKQINEIMLPALFEKIDELLTVERGECASV